MRAVTFVPVIATQSGGRQRAPDRRDQSSVRFPSDNLAVRLGGGVPNLPSEGRWGEA